MDRKHRSFKKKHIKLVVKKYSWQRRPYFESQEDDIRYVVDCFNRNNLADHMSGHRREYLRDLIAVVAAIPLAANEHNQHAVPLVAPVQEGMAD